MLSIQVIKGDKEMLNEGQLAPDFELPDENNQIHKLSDYKGKPVVLYFYPKDNTPGCTKEACSFRDSFEEFRNAGVIVLGVSPDPPESHVGFKLKHQLPFTLLSDIDHKVCELYGVWGKKKFMGKEYDGVLRTTFVIDKNGKIMKIFHNVKPDEHSNEVLELFNKS